MSKVKDLRGLVNQRLTAAAEEIFELFERTIAEYEEQLRGTKEEKHKLLDAVFNPKVRLHRADVQQLLVSDMEVSSETQERNSSLDQENPPGPAHFKEEQEELWSSQEEEQHQEEETDEDDGEKPWSSQLLEIQTEDIQQLSVTTEEPQESLDQEDPPEPAHIKEEQEGEQLQGLEEAEIKSTLTPVLMKSDEDDNEEKPQPDETNDVQSKEEPQESLDQEEPPGPAHIKEEQEGEQLQGLMDPPDEDVKEEKPQSSQLLENKEEPRDTGGCGGSDVDTDESGDWKESGEPPENKAAPKSEPSNGDAAVIDLMGPKPRRASQKKTDKPFKCKICGQGFDKKKKCVQHFTRYHIDGRHFPCWVCNRTFKCKGGLVGHMRDHTGEKPYKCTLCDEAFPRLQALKLHIARHKGEKPYTCTKCKEGFWTAYGLNEHRHTHTGGPPTCSICSISFPTKKKYYKHMKIHVREKPYVCAKCNKRFLKRLTLKRHMTVHRGPTRTTCGVCNKTYHSEYAKIHKCKVKEVVTEKKKKQKVRCDACNRSFTANYVKYHKCKARGKKADDAAGGGSADSAQGVSDPVQTFHQHVGFSAQSSRDQVSTPCRPPVITCVRSHFNLLMQKNPEFHSPSVDFTEH